MRSPRIATEWMQKCLQEAVMIDQRRDDGGWDQVVDMQVEDSGYFGGETG